MVMSIMDTVGGVMSIMDTVGGVMSIMYTVGGVMSIMHGYKLLVDTGVSHTLSLPLHIVLLAWEPLYCLILELVHGALCQ